MRLLDQNPSMKFFKMVDAFSLTDLCVAGLWTFLTESNRSYTWAFLKKFYCVSFVTNDLVNPKAEPIGMFDNYGERIYVWADVMWGEFMLSADTFINSGEQCLNKMTEQCLNKMTAAVLTPEIMNLDRLMKFFVSYKLGLNPSDMWYVNADQYLFSRVLYKLSKSVSAMILQHTCSSP